jgi:hypothetical protein
VDTAATTSFTHNGSFDAGRIYYYKVSSVNSTGESGLSDASSGVQYSAPPDAPTNVQAVIGNDYWGDYCIDVSWSGPVGINRYLIQIYRNGSVDGPPQLLYTDSYQHTYPNIGAAYTYQVSSINNDDVGSEWSSLSAAVTVPAGPTNFMVTETTPFSFTVTWNGVTDVNSYQVQYRNGSIWYNEGSPVSTTTYSKTNAVQGSNEGYRVVSISNGILCGASSDTTITIPSATSLTLGTPVPNNQITSAVQQRWFSFTATSGNTITITNSTVSGDLTVIAYDEPNLTNRLAETGVGTGVYNVSGVSSSTIVFVGVSPDTALATGSFDIQAD